MLFRRSAAALILIGGLVGLAGQAAPQDVPPGTSITWSVAPSVRAEEPDRPNFVVAAEPGETVSDSLVVTNRSDVALVLGVYARDAFNTSDGKIDLLAGDQDPVDIGRWTAVDAPSITVPAGGEVNVPFTISIPADASPGDHVGGIVTSLTVTESDADGNRVRVERRLGTRIYLRVAGDLVPELRFTKVRARYEGSWNPFVSGSMVVDYTVTNTGNVRLRAERIARVATGLGLPERTDQPDDMDELLPGNTYDLTQTVTGVWPAFGTAVDVELRPYDSLSSSDVAPAPLIGRFRTSMFPTPQAVAIVLLILFVALLWRSRRRNRKKMQHAIEAAISRALAEKDAPGSAVPAAAPTAVPTAVHDPGTPPPWPPGTPPAP